VGLVYDDRSGLLFVAGGGARAGAGTGTVTAYRGDLQAFVAWAGRAGIEGPEGVDRIVLRRYLAFLSTRRYARRTVARKASSVRRYFAWAARTG